MLLPHSALYHLQPRLIKCFFGGACSGASLTQIWLHDLFPWIQMHNVALLLPTDLFTPFVQVSLFGMQSSSPLTMPPLQTHLCGFSHLSPTPWIPSCLLSAGHTFYPIAHWCPPPYKLATHWACTWFICIIQSPWRQLCSAQFCSSHNSKHYTYKSSESSNACWIEFLSSAFDQLKDCSSKLAKSNDGRNLSGEPEGLLFSPAVPICLHCSSRAQSCWAEGSDSAPLLDKHRLKHICLHQRLHTCFFFFSYWETTYCSSICL